MTLLSITPDAYLDRAPSVSEARPQRRRNVSRAARAVAVTLALASLTVPTAVAHAKWSKLNLVVAMVQHRYLPSLGV